MLLLVAGGEGQGFLAAGAGEAESDPALLRGLADSVQDLAQRFGVALRCRVAL
ncbi:hypothetical protein [Streptomyces sp. NPDC012888]|uniref:hypothetical protein n=1 Tax=Streptomyces sp. NPDC012888 TaxID=3364855 RepID=UPI0036A51D96